MSEAELLSARDAMAALGINENDLQTLVARGDLRAFRSAGTMKFKREDVMSIKTDKGTEPTIIIPAAGLRKGSGILPNSATTTTAAAPVASSTSPAKPPSEEIVLEDVELMPVDDATSTQQVTAQQTLAPTAGGTAVQPSPDQTGESTVLEAGGASTTGAAPVPVAPAARGSGVGAPAMSRVRQVGSGVTVASSRRTHAIYQAKSGNWVWNIPLVLTTLVFVFAALICSVMLSKGYYDEKSGQRVIPPFLAKGSTLEVYAWCYDKTPGDPQDEKQTLH